MLTARPAKIGLEVQSANSSVELPENADEVDDVASTLLEEETES
jgi:hypothetical protein